MISNSTKQSNSTVELGVMYPTEPFVHQQWHSPSIWNTNRDFELRWIRFFKQSGLINSKDRTLSLVPSSVVLAQMKNYKNFEMPKYFEHGWSKITVSKRK